MSLSRFLPALLVMAGVTYLIRALPFILVKKKITNRYVLSFLQYLPYTVLACMTVPACFSATGSLLSAAVGFLVATVLAWRNRPLLVVAIGAAGGALVTELIRLAIGG